MDFQSIINTVCFYVILYEIPYCRNLNTLYKPGKAPLFLLYCAGLLIDGKNWDCPL